MMSTELAMLGLTTALGLVQLALAAATARRQDGLRWAIGPRDVPPPPLTGIAGRLSRARANFMETFPFFAASVLAVHAAGCENALSGRGAELYFWARLVYVPVYVAGIPVIRSFTWGVSIVGLVMVLLALTVG